MVVAVLSLIGFLLSTYLTLWKFGFMGVLACGSGSCEAVQTSSYATLLGLPVAAYGIGGYLALLIVSLKGLQPDEANVRRTTVWLVALAGGGVAFTAYLSYLEAFVIDAWCRWCLVSAAIIVVIFLASLSGLRSRSSSA